MEITQVMFAALCILIGVLLGMVCAFGYVIMVSLRNTHRQAEAEAEMADALKSIFKPSNIKRRTKDTAELEDENGTKVKVRKVKLPKEKDELNSSVRPDRTRDQDD